MLPNHNPTETTAWQRLEMHFLSMQATHMRELFAEDANRFQKFHTTFEDILVDYSKNMVIDEIMKELFALANETELKIVQYFTRPFETDRILPYWLMVPM